MSAVMATLIILAIIALGEVFSIISRAKIPTLLVVVVVFFTLLQIGVLPKDILAASTFTVIGAVLQPAILVHMGTLIPLKVMKQQYKAVIITLIGITISCIMMLAAVSIFLIMKLQSLGQDRSRAVSLPILLQQKGYRHRV